MYVVVFNLFVFPVLLFFQTNFSKMFRLTKTTVEIIDNYVFLNYPAGTFC